MSDAAETPSWPESPPGDWLTFHLAHPGPGNAWPGDPNCVFHYKGRYHLHYIYHREDGFAFAHVSSRDMVRWTWHPTVLTATFAGHGMFSGTGFYAKDGTPAIIYQGQGPGRAYIAFAQDDALDSWSTPEVVTARDEQGNEVDLPGGDPDCWRNGDTYYALTSGRNSPLLRSSDLKNWEHVGPFYHDDYPADIGVPREEDASCANMFRIGDPSDKLWAGKWMLLCISHPLGCRYYLGDFKDEQYLPEFHAMMNWQRQGDHGFFFAPESVLTDDGRRVMWAWLMKGASPTGAQSLPRELELPADGVLRIKPLRELETLRYDETTETDVRVESYTDYKPEGITGDALELRVTVASPLPAELRINLLGDEEGNGGVDIVAGAQRLTLKIGSIDPPFALASGEDLTLRIFIDKNLVEVFANDRQAAVFPHDQIRTDPNIRLFARGGAAVVREIRSWKMKTIY